ncbi:hypothetical protein ACHAQH_006714 [Verticillium albo-atrum]
MRGNPLAPPAGQEQHQYQDRPQDQHHQPQYHQQRQDQQHQDQQHQDQQHQDQQHQDQSAAFRELENFIRQENLRPINSAISQEQSDENVRMYLNSEAVIHPEVFGVPGNVPSVLEDGGDDLFPPGVSESQYQLPRSAAIDSGVFVEFDECLDQSLIQKDQEHTHDNLEGRSQMNPGLDLYPDPEPFGPEDLFQPPSDRHERNALLFSFDSDILPQMPPLNASGYVTYNPAIVLETNEGQDIMWPIGSDNHAWEDSRSFQDG